MINKNMALLCALGLLAFPVTAYAEEQQDANPPLQSGVAQAEEDVKLVPASIPAASSDVDKMIKEQLEAIRSRNDRAAYELNTADVKDNYADPQSFMRMIRREKPSLYDHVSYELLKAVVPDSKFHKVRLTNRYGDRSIAMFKVEQDESGAWRTRDIIMLSGGKDPI